MLPDSRDGVSQRGVDCWEHNLAHVKIAANNNHINNLKQLKFHVTKTTKIWDKWCKISNVQESCVSLLYSLCYFIIPSTERHACQLLLTSRDVAMIGLRN